MALIQLSAKREPNLRIVTAHHLKNWADTTPIDAQTEIAELIRGLVRASCPDLTSYRFPSGNASQTPGWDGMTELENGVTSVPKGRTVWEFGVGADYKSKANEDYKKRTRDLPPEERGRHTFIFVTPRIWDTGLEDWIQNHSGDGWRQVRIYDANTLENWLAERPAVSIAFAKRLGILPPTGFQTVNDLWEEHSLNTIPPLIEDLFLRGREERSNRLCKGLSVGLGGLSKWQADSATEAALFIAATIRKTEKELSQFLSSKTLFILSPEAAKQLPPTGGFNLILFPETHRVGPRLTRTNQVILVLGADNRASEVESLDQMSTQDFAAGLQAVGIEQIEAFRIAGICCRSTVVFSRLFASGTVTPPNWSNDSNLVPLILAGSWDASNEHDRAVIAALCDKTYNQVDQDARRFKALPDAPLNLDGSIWTIRSPKDAFTLMGSLVGEAHQNALRNACITVFSEIDRTLDVPDEEQPVIPTRGADFLHSEWLRRGLSRTLLLIAGLHGAARFKTIGMPPGQFVDRIVGAVMNLSGDIRTLASLKAEFPTLIEAAPFPLASALEQVLRSDSKEWATVIFRGIAGSSLFRQTSPHTFILWALETLAWDPEYLYQSASMLIRLAQIDPGGNTQNRPMDSLRRIFLAWRPYTYASLEQRISVVSRICRMREEVGFKLAVALLMTWNSTHETAKPKVRDFGDAARTPLTHEHVLAAYQAYTALAIELSKGHADRLVVLVENFAKLVPELRESAILSMRSAALSANAVEKYELWTKLRVFTQRFRRSPGGEWAVLEKHLDALETLCEEIAPADPVQRDLWQFNDVVPTIQSLTTGDYVQEANRCRADVVRRILDDSGISSVLALARAAKEPHLVGAALAEVSPSQGVLEDIFNSEFNPSSAISENFFVAVSGAAHLRFSASWDRWIADRAREFEARRGAIVFLGWPDGRDTWNFVQNLGRAIEEEYWKLKPAFNQSSDDDLLISIEKYNAVGRFSASLELVAYQEERVPTSVCTQTLRGLVGEVNAGNWRSPNAAYSVVHLLSALQKRDDVTTEELALLEYRYLPLLEHHGKPVALVQLLQQSPKFFIEMVCEAFFPASQEERGEISEEHRAKARSSYQVLQSMRSLPGFTESSQDVDILRNWIAEARDLATKADRKVITDQQIGQMMAHAPVDPEDNAWPVRSVRDVIEEFASDEIETGISVSRFNMRGTFTKALYEGGQEERAFAVKYREWAQAAVRWPRTSRMLHQIANGWEGRAEQADIRAELDQRHDY